jgi:ubiquinone/menaquinone biosynthesis C-methylase UbiE
MSDEHSAGASAPEPNDIARAYDRWAAHYDADRNATRDLDARVLRDADLRLDARVVLELGCGTGKNTRWLATRASEVLAMDFSPGMLAVARGAVGAPNVRFVEHDLRDPWPVADASIDIVVGNLVLEHVEALGPVYAAAARVLRPGGQLFLCELHPARQLRGGQAHFTDRASGETVYVDAYIHSVSEYVNAGLRAGMVLRELGEWGDGDGGAPRLVSVLFER